MGRATGLHDSFTGVFGDIRGLRPEQEKELDAALTVAETKGPKLAVFSRSKPAAYRRAALLKWLSGIDPRVRYQRLDEIAHAAPMYEHIHSHVGREWHCRRDLDALSQRQNHIFEVKIVREVGLVRYILRPEKQWSKTSQKAYQDYLNWLES